jgi:hypothetical protein
LGGEDGGEAELDVGFGDDLFKDEAFVDVLPAVGKAAGVEEDDAVTGDAEVLEVSVEGEEAALPALLAEVEEAVEPEFDFFEPVGSGEGGEVAVEGVFDAGGGFRDGEPAGPAADANADGGEGDDLRDERGAGEAGAGEALPAAVVVAVDAPDVANVFAEPEGPGEHHHDALDEDAEEADLAAGVFEEAAGEKGRKEGFGFADGLPEEDEGDDFRGGAGALDNPVRRGVDDLADALAEADEAAGGEFGRGVQEIAGRGQRTPPFPRYPVSGGMASEIGKAKGAPRGGRAFGERGNRKPVRA